MLNDSIDVQFVAGTREKQSTGRVAEDVEIAIVHGAKDAISLIVRGQRSPDWLTLAIH